MKQREVPQFIINILIVLATVITTAIVLINLNYF